MIQYRTSTPNAPPATDQFRSQAMKDFGFVPDFGYGPNFQDNMARLSGAGQFDRDAQMANADYGTRQIAAERQSVLAGLNMLADERTRQQNRATMRVAGLLGNLFK